ncbi:hypothetical protein BGZ83_011798 [Gryganskiella cystojenkinii]|nr:hypothetical protein BGZ83_011798 [Gryganskiella cystojenkinii]
MDTASATKQPAKLRWRPYSSGSTKTRKTTNSTTSDEINAKALAHKVRTTAYAPSNKNRRPAGVILHWEEGETVETMSRGGLPHNQPHHQPIPRQQQNGRTETTSYRTTGVTSLPSPRTSTSPPSLPRLDLVGGTTSDLGQYKATIVPVLTRQDLRDHGIDLPSFEANGSYKLALDALLQNHRRNQELVAQAPAIALTSVPAPMSVASPPASLVDSKQVQGAFASAVNRSERKLSSAELLGIVNIDELLASCGYTDTTSSEQQQSGKFFSSFSSGTTTLASPAASDSLPPPSSITTFEAMQAQAPALLAQGDSRHLLQQQSPQTLIGPSPTLSSASTTSTQPIGADQNNTSPFGYRAHHNDPLINGNDDPSPWPSLFPTSADETLSETAMMTVPPTFPLSPSTTSGLLTSNHSPLSPMGGIHQEELDPDWNSYLDEASPLFETDADAAMAALPVLLSPITPIFAPTTPPRLDSMDAGGDVPERKSSWDWSVLQQQNEDGNSNGGGSGFLGGHRGFPQSRGPFGLGSGSAMIRSFNGQQRSGYHTQARSFSRRGGGGGPQQHLPPPSSITISREMASALQSSPESSDTEQEQPSSKNSSPSIPPSSFKGASSEESKSDRKVDMVAQIGRVGKGTSAVKETGDGEQDRDGVVGGLEGFSGLLSMFKRLWRGGGGGGVVGGGGTASSSLSGEEK